MTHPTPHGTEQATCSVCGQPCTVALMPPVRDGLPPARIAAGHRCAAGAPCIAGLLVDVTTSAERKRRLLEHDYHGRRACPACEAAEAARGEVG